MLKSLLQTTEWAEFKAKFGWRSSRYGHLQALERQLGFSKTLLYFPEISLGDEFRDALKRVKEEHSTFARIFTRFEFLELWTPQRAKSLVEAGLIKSFEDVQPDYRQWVVLDRSEATLLKEMKPKGRYNLRLAERHKLKVEWGTGDELLEAFIGLYRTTARRSGFSGRSSEYFHSLWQTLKAGNYGEIVAVKHDNEVVAAAIISFYSGVASYLYGGSGGDRTLMAPYLMHWAAIKRAKKRGCAIYDLLAIAPPDKPNHPHTGLTRFKTQFGGQSVRLLGSWDFVQSRLWYTIYKFIERRRRRAI